MSKTQPENIHPRMRLPQVPPLKVVARRQFRQPSIIEPSTAYSLPMIEPVTPRPIYHEDYTTFQPSISPLPVTPPLRASRFEWKRTRSPGDISTPGIPVTVSRLVPTRRRRRELRAGEILLGCGMLMLVGVLLVALLYFISAAH
jgi:hypothetical protein